MPMVVRAVTNVDCFKSVVVTVQSTEPVQEMLLFVACYLSTIHRLQIEMAPLTKLTPRSFTVQRIGIMLNFVIVSHAVSSSYNFSMMSNLCTFRQINVTAHSYEVLLLFSDNLMLCS